MPKRSFRRIIIIGGALLLVALVVGFIPQFRQRQVAHVWTPINSRPLGWQSFRQNPTMPASGLTLPAEVRPWAGHFDLSRKVSGYLKTAAGGHWCAR